MQLLVDYHCSSRRRHLLAIGPADKWIPGWVPGRDTDATDFVFTANSWWTTHLCSIMKNSDSSRDEYGLPRREVPPGLRAAFFAGDMEGDMEGCGRSSRSVLVRRSCRVAPSPATATPAPSAASKAKHSKPIREAIDACRVSLLKQARGLMDSVLKKAGHKHSSAAVAAAAAAQDDYDPTWHEVAALNTPHWNDYDSFWQWVAALRVEVAAYWVLREDARRQQDEEGARAGVWLAEARAAAPAGGGECGSSGPAGAVETNEAAEVLNEYKCPITAEIMTDPVCTADGFTYEFTAIAEWLLTNDTSPSTGAKLACKRLIPNVTVRCLLQRLVVP